MTRPANKKDNFGIQIDAEQMKDKLMRMPPKFNPDESKYLVKTLVYNWRVYITSTDLFVDDLNFLFGMGCFETRTCIISSRRYQDRYNDMKSPKFFRNLSQTIVHEMGHNLVLEHCKTYECMMNGRNTIEEAEQDPPDFCPRCLSKLIHLRREGMTFNLQERYKTMISILNKYGLNEDAECLKGMGERHTI